SVRALATNWRPSSSILSPLPIDMPTCATLPLTLTRPSAMRCSSARREPSPAWARTLCRRSCMRGASVPVSLPRLSVSLRFFSSVISLLLRRGHDGVVLLLLFGHVRVFDAGFVVGLRGFVRFGRRCFRRGIGCFSSGEGDAVVVSRVFFLVGIGRIGGIGVSGNSAGVDRSGRLVLAVELELRF